MEKSSTVVSDCTEHCYVVHRPSEALLLIINAQLQKTPTVYKGLKE